LEKVLKRGMGGFCQGILVRLLVDAFAWIEYLAGTARGSRAKEFVEGDNELITLSTTLAEVVEHSLREGRNPLEGILVIKTRSRIIDLSEEIALKAGETSFERKKFVKGWSMHDSYVFAAAQLLGAKILTGDQHFKNAGNTVMI
jgi:predicted nucleic acid-binding protein